MIPPFHIIWKETIPNGKPNHLHRWNEAVHVVASIAVITEQQLVVILAGSAKAAGLTLYALPGVLPHRDHHVPGELETCGVT